MKYKHKCECNGCKILVNTIDNFKKKGKEK